MTTTEALSVGRYWAGVAAMLSDALARIERERGMEGNAYRHESDASDARQAFAAITAVIRTPNP
jgi:hypothetical protein